MEIISLINIEYKIGRGSSSDDRKPSLSAWTHVSPRSQARCTHVSTNSVWLGGLTCVQIKFGWVDSREYRPTGSESDNNIDHTLTVTGVQHQHRS